MSLPNSSQNKSETEGVVTTSPTNTHTEPYLLTTYLWENAKDNAGPIGLSVQFMDEDEWLSVRIVNGHLTIVRHAGLMRVPSGVLVTETTLMRSDAAVQENAAD